MAAPCCVGIVTTRSCSEAASCAHRAQRALAWRSASLAPPGAAAGVLLAPPGAARARIAPSDAKGGVLAGAECTRPSGVLLARHATEDSRRSWRHGARLGAFSLYFEGLERQSKPRLRGRTRQMAPRARVLIVLAPLAGTAPCGAAPKYANHPGHLSCARPRARRARCPRALAEGPLRPLSIYFYYIYLWRKRPAPPRRGPATRPGATAARSALGRAPPRPAMPRRHVPPRPDSPHTAPPVHTRHAAPKRSQPFRVLPIDGYTYISG